jgi:hypothetical protein
MTDLQTQLLHETAQIPWRELQRFFAAGQAIAVDASLDLLEVANTLAQDDATCLKAWMAAGKVDVVSDQQAAQWFEQDAQVWAVVIKPWVLVQQRSTH